MEPFEELEVEFGFWAGRSHTVGCSSGTAALHLALESFQLPLGSECIVPDFTMIACARAVTLAGLTPRFADCDDNLLVTIETLEKAVTDKTVAVMLVHVYGRRVHPSVFDWCRDRGYYVIEDCAEFHGGKTDPLADASCWSFYRNKIVAGEEGGMIAFRRKEHAQLAKQLRSLGFTDSHSFWHVPRGHNYRLSNAHASLILESLALANGTNRPKRRLIETWYNEQLPKRYRMPPRECCWVYDIRVPGMNWEQQSEIVRRLNLSGVAARQSFKPMSLQSEYVSNGKNWMYDITKSVESNAARLSQEVMYLPIHPDMTEHNVQCYVARLLDTIHAVLPAASDSLPAAASDCSR